MAAPMNKTRFLTAAALGGAGLVAASGAIHLDLWVGSYRFVPTIGPLFLAQGVSALAVAGLVVAWRRLPALILAAGLMLSTIGGYVLSAEVGLFGFRDSFAAPLGRASLGVEAAAAVVLVAAAIAGGGRVRLRPATKAG